MNPSVPAARVVFSPEDRQRILALVDRALRTGSLTLGPCGQDLEAAFAARHNARFAVATSSGTSALEIIFRTIGVAGSDVVVPANTFFATAAAVLHAGGRPRFADIDASTMALSAATVEAALTPQTTAVVLVHIGGVITPEVVAIQKLCAARGLTLIEDAAHAHGATLDGQHAGAWSTAAAFSLYPTKVIASGEGGLILTPDERLVEEARIYRDQGKGSFLGGGHVRLGSAWRMSELHAAVGLVHLDRLGQFIAVRRRVAAHYDAALAGLDGITPILEPPGCRSNYYKYPALLDPTIDRAALKARLRDGFGVALSGEVYATPLHQEPIFADLAPAAGTLAVAEDVCARHVCLPVHSDMTDDEAGWVIEALRQAVPS